MAIKKEVVAGKLRRWEKYLNNYRLPCWEDIPDFGLYMEQVLTLLTKYLDYMPPELKEEQFITAATINNYVRKKIMPEPATRSSTRSSLLRQRQPASRTSRVTERSAVCVLPFTMQCRSKALRSSSSS